jgi:hypothetical protein
MFESQDTKDTKDTKEQTYEFTSMSFVSIVVTGARHADR